MKPKVLTADELRALPRLADVAEKEREEKP